MAKIKYNVKGVDAGGDRTMPKAGVHRAKVISCVDAKPSDKDRRLELQYQVQDDEPKGSKGYVLYDYINIERDDLAWKLAQFVKAMGLPDSGAFDPEDVVGTALNVRVKIQPETEQYSAKAAPATLLPLDGEDEEDEDLSDDEDADDEEAADEEEEGEDEPYTEEDLAALSNDELKEVAEEFEVTVPQRITAKGKAKLIASILEAQDADEDEDDEDEYTEEDLNEMDEAGIKEVLEEFELDADDYTKTTGKGKKKKSTFDMEAAIEGILEAQDESEDEEADEEPEEETPDYDSMDISDLKALAKERKLDAKGSKKVLIARLKKDDEPF